MASDEAPELLPKSFHDRLWLKSGATKNEIWRTRNVRALLRSGYKRCGIATILGPTAPKKIDPASPTRLAAGACRRNGTQRLVPAMRCTRGFRQRHVLR